MLVSKSKVWKSRSVSDRRNDRMHELMVVTTRLFNRNGFLSTRIEEIADAMQTTPGSIYHYVASKEELAYRCYLRSCDIRRSQLEHANDPENSGLENIISFLSNVLVENQNRTAIIGELSGLKLEWSNRIRRLQRANVILCQQMIAKGVEDGSIGPMNPLWAGVGIIGIVEWISLWYTKRLKMSKKEITDSMIDIIVNGVTKNRTFDVHLPRLEAAYPPKEPADPFDKKALAEQKLQHFLRVALDSFNRNGVKATSIDQIAQKLNVTKGAFYYYFKNKEDLLYQCYERAIAFAFSPFPNAGSKDSNELEVYARRSLFERHILESGPLPVYQNLTFLSAGHKDRVMGELLDIEGDQHRIERGIKNGYFRDVNPFIAEKVRAGLINWFPVWFSAKGPATPTEIADNHSHLFLNGLRP